MPASPTPLIPDTIIGRRIDLLGRVQGVALGSANNGQQTTIFTTNDMDFRGQSVYVAYVSVELITVIRTADGNAYGPASGNFDVNVVISLGAAGGNDWTGGPQPLWLLGFPVASPAVLYNGIQSGGSIPVVQYGPGVAFTVVNNSTGASSQVCQVSAYGWAFG